MKYRISANAVWRKLHSAFLSAEYRSQSVTLKPENMLVTMQQFWAIKKCKTDQNEAIMF